MNAKTYLFLILALFAACKSDPANTPKNTAATPNPAIETTPTTNIIADLNHMIINKPNDLSLYIERGKAYAKAENYEQAMYDFKHVIKKDSLYPDAYHMMSDVYMDTNQSKDAIQILEKAGRLFPNRIPTLLKLSETYFILKDFDRSSIAATSVLSRNPQEAEGYFMLGLNFKAINDPQKAINSFQTAVEMNPDLIDAWLYLGELYEAKKDPLALSYYNAAVRVDTANINVLHAKAYYLQNNEKIPEALDVYKKIVRMDKFYEGSYLNSGILNLEMDRIPAAKEQFVILTKMAPENYLGHYYLGITNEIQGNFDVARENMRTAAILNPRDAKIKKAIERISDYQKDQG